MGGRRLLDRHLRRLGRVAMRHDVVGAQPDAEERAAVASERRALPQAAATRDGEEMHEPHDGGRV